MTTDRIKVLLVDDHALFREGVKEILKVEGGIQVVGEAENGTEAVALAAEKKPNVVLLDVEMPVMGAERAIGQILRASPSSKVLVLSMYDEPRLVRKLLSLGAHGYIVKNTRGEELIAAVCSTYRVQDRVILSVSRNTIDRLEGSGKGTLSSRELEILLLAARAMSNREIASHLHISEGTVKRHFTHIYAKLSVYSRADATKKALTSGLITFRDLSEELSISKSDNGGFTKRKWT
jgi:DNA-binding NarL/FixJ family response regulator